MSMDNLFMGNAGVESADGASPTIPQEQAMGTEEGADPSFPQDAPPEGGEGDKTGLPENIFQWPTGHPRAQESQAGDEGSEGQNPPGQSAAPIPKKDPSRFEYWQSKAMQLEAALKKQAPELTRLKLYEPVVRYLDENPDILNGIVQRLEAPLQAAAPAVPARADLGGSAIPQKPVLPARPARYDPTEAATDPNSESFKYRVAMDEYNFKMAEYMEHKERIAQQREAETQRQMAQRAFMQRRLAETRQQLISQYGMTPQQAQDFIIKMTDPSTLELDTLVRFYKTTISPERRAAAPQRRPNDAIRMPLPGNMLGSEPTAPKLTEEEAFNLSLFNAGTRKR